MSSPNSRRNGSNAACISPSDSIVLWSRSRWEVVGPPLLLWFATIEAVEGGGGSYEDVLEFPLASRTSLL